MPNPRRDLVHLARGEPIPRELLERLVLEEKLPIGLIATRLGVGEQKIWYWRRKYAISAIERTTRYVLPPIEGQLKSLFLGSMLGDGGLLKQVHATRYQEAHCPEQLPYLEWKRGIWGDWAPHPIYESREYTRKDGTQVKPVNMFTLSSAKLTYYHDRFYVPGRRDKGFPITLVDAIDPFALAVWYMDDGHAGWWPSIAFDLDLDSKNTVYSILEKFGFKPTWVWGNLQINGDEQAERFLDLVRPHIHPCLEYKLHPGFLQADRRARDSLLPLAARQEACANKTPIKRIAKQLGMSPTAVKTRLQKSGFSYSAPIGRPEKFTPDVISKFTGLYTSGTSISAIARQLGFSRMTVLKYMRDNSIQRGWLKDRGTTQAI